MIEDEVLELLAEAWEHVTDCFPQLEVLQETHTHGHMGVVDETGFHLTATSNICRWTIKCPMCHWQGSVIVQDNTPSWEEPPEMGGEPYDQDTE